MYRVWLSGLCEIGYCAGLWRYRCPNGDPIWTIYEPDYWLDAGGDIIAKRLQPGDMVLCSNRNGAAVVYMDSNLQAVNVGDGSPTEWAR